MGLYDSRDHLGVQHTLNVNWASLLELAFLVNFPYARSMGVNICIYVVPVCIFDR